MPRQPSLMHPVWRVRNILGKTREEFARITGIPEETIHAIESAQLRLSEDNALRIYAATGADPGSLKTNVKGDEGFLKGAVSAQHPKDVTGRAYDRDSILVHQHIATNFTDYSQICAAKWTLDFMLQAAKSRGRLLPVLLSFYCWLEQTSTDSALHEPAERLMGDKDRKSAEDHALDGVPPGTPDEDVIRALMKDGGTSKWPSDPVGVLIRERAVLTRHLRRQMEDAEEIGPPPAN